MARLKERFFAVAPGEVYPRWFEVGEEVSGELERLAGIDGLLEAPKRAPRRKVLGVAPENKASD